MNAMIYRGGRPAMGFGLGTIANFISVAELADLVRAKDYQVHQLYKTFLDFLPTWQTRDTRTAFDWQTDFAQLRTRYDTARTNAQRAIDAARYVPLPNSAIPAQDAWDDLLKSLRKNWDGTTGGALVKGDLADLSNRLEAAGGHPDYSQTPQPDIRSDFDLNAFKAADVTIKTLEKTWPKAQVIGIGVVGVVVVAGVVYLLARR